MNKASKPWDASEIQYVKERYGKDKVACIAAVLGRTPHAVQSQLTKLGITVHTVKRVKGTLCRQDIPNRPLKAFHELERDECQYGFGVDEVRFCGKTIHKRTYCEEHYNMCYKPPSVRK